MIIGGENNMEMRAKFDCVIREGFSEEVLFEQMFEWWEGASLDCLSNSSIL